MSVQCPICFKTFKRLNNSHIQSHGLTVDDFLSKYPNILRTEKEQQEAEKLNHDEYITCPICFKKFKELNAEHLFKHDLTISEFHLKYPNIERVSKNTRINKNTFKNMTSETSEKLKRGHTLEGYIEKHGKEKGTELLLKAKENKSTSHTLSGFIDRYGSYLGKHKFEQNKRKRLCSLEGFQERYGEEEGMKRYFIMTEKQSKNSRFFEEDQKRQYYKYRRLVRRISNISINEFGLCGVENRGRKFHVDHKYPIIHGFLENINPVIIGSIYNLEMLPSNLNCTKKIQKSTSLEILKEKVNQTPFYQQMIQSIIF